MVSMHGRIRNFKLGGVYLKKQRRAEGGAKIFGVFRVKNNDFTRKNHIFPILGGAPGARPPLPPGSAPAMGFYYTIKLQRILVFCVHCRQRAPVENVLSASGTSHLGMIDIQATTKSKYYDHIVLLYLETRRCRHLSIIFVCFYLYVTVGNFIDYSDMDKMMDINNDKC